MSDDPQPYPSPLAPGQRLARGVARALRTLDFVTVDELVRDEREIE